jgi:hypothetical protein
MKSKQDCYSNTKEGANGESNYDRENLLMINILKIFQTYRMPLPEDSILSKEYLFGRKAVVDCFIYSNSAN